MFHKMKKLRLLKAAGLFLFYETSSNSYALCASFFYRKIAFSASKK